MSRRPIVHLNLENKDANHAKQIDRRNPDKDGIVQMKDVRTKRIEEEAKFIEKYLTEKSNALEQELLLANKEVEKQKLIIFGLLKDKQKNGKSKA